MRENKYVQVLVSPVTFIFQMLSPFSSQCRGSMQIIVICSLKGLSRMKRNHIHFAPGEPGDDEVISGYDYCHLLLTVVLKQSAFGNTRIVVLIFFTLNEHTVSQS